MSVKFFEESLVETKEFSWTTEKGSKIEAIINIVPDYFYFEDYNKNVLSGKDNNLNVVSFKINGKEIKSSRIGYNMRAQKYMITGKLNSKDEIGAILSKDVYNELYEERDQRNQKKEEENEEIRVKELKEYNEKREQFAYLTKKEFKETFGY